jgi:hypothetical protein
MGYVDLKNVNSKEKKKYAQKFVVFACFLYFLLSICSYEYEYDKMTNGELFWSKIILLCAPILVIAIKKDDMVRIDTIHYFYTAWQVLACWWTNTKFNSILFILGVFICLYSWHTKGSCYMSEIVYDESKSEDENHFIRSNFIKEYNIPDWYLIVSIIFLFIKIKSNDNNFFFIS